MLTSAFSPTALDSTVAYGTRNDGFSRLRSLSTFAQLVVAAALIAGAPTVISAASFGTNLVVNGDAEANTVTDFASSPGFPTLSYSYDGGFPVAGDPGVSEGGGYFFYAGETGVTTAAQLLDVSSLGTSIDRGSVGFTLSALLGGYLTQNDQAMLPVSFIGAGNVALGGDVIGPVTDTDRAELTGLRDRSATGFVPTGTRSINGLLTQTRFAGSSNDGYADNLSLVLDDRPAPGGVPAPATWAMMLGGFGMVGNTMRRLQKARVYVS